MGNELTILSRHRLTASVSAMACIVTLSGCMAMGKPKDVAQADPAPAAATPQQIALTPGEQLAADLNAKAAAQAQRPGGYRDPMVHTGNGQQMMAQQSATAMYPAAPQPPASVAAAPANIGGLVTQPTAVNANRSSIYSSAPPIAVNPDGTLAGPTAAYPQQGAAPSLRSVYSMPAGAMNSQPQMGMMPVNQASQTNMPQNAPPQSIVSSGRPTADATPSRILPAPGSREHRLSSQEALMVARNMASQAKNPPGSPAMPQMGQGVALPPGISLPPGVTLTPGMNASLKQPI